MEAKLKTDKKRYEETEIYKEWKKEISDEYNERIAAAKEALQEAYAEVVKQRTANYPIFMAIAEDIGYDATGKATNTNELKGIAGELKRFIEAIDKGTDSFFALALQ